MKDFDDEKESLSQADDCESQHFDDWLRETIRDAMYYDEFPDYQEERYDMSFRVQDRD